MNRLGSGELVRNAFRAGTAIPGFNIPYLPMVEPVVRALRDTRTFGFIMVARPEWIKFRAGSPLAVLEEYRRHADERFTRMHLDHIPVIDEDGLPVEYEPVLRGAVEAGYDSVMVDGSRLPLAENIRCTKLVVDAAHGSNVPVEAELGAVLGHEAGPLPPYEELFASGRGFTDVDEAVRFVRETAVDWLSVAVGNIHGALADGAREKRKPAARLDIAHLRRIRDAVGIPLVLHGGTGIPAEYVSEGIRNGIAKVNVATAIRQPYEREMASSPERALEAVYEAVIAVVRDDLRVIGNADAVNPPA